MKNTKDLIKRQDAPDKPEDLAKIPTLTRDDLTTDVPDYPLEETSFYDGTSFYHAEQFTSGIDYVGLYFDISDFEAEEYEALGFLSDLLSSLGTEKYDVAKLQTEIDTHTGGIYGTVSIFENQNGIIQPYFVLKRKSIRISLIIYRIVKRNMTATDFTDTVEISKITQRLISGFEGAINSRSIFLLRIEHSVKCVRQQN